MNCKRIYSTILIAAIAIFFASTVILSQPNIQINPDQFHLDINEDQTSTQTLTIQNVGDSILEYNISAELTNGLELLKAANQDYRWRDSNQPGGPNFQWIDITTTGTKLNVSGDDNYGGPFDIGLPFTFYGVEYTQFYVCTNGFVSFTSTSSENNNTYIPSSYEPNSLLAAFWDDLISYSIYHYYDGTKAIIEFENSHHFTSSSSYPYTFEIILYPSGKIVYQYQNMSGILTSATVGIENQDGTEGIQVAYNEDYIENNLAIEFFKGPLWLTFNPTSGLVPQSGSTDIQLTFDATDLQGGSYDANLIIESNDPVDSVLTVPVTLNVTSQPDIATNLDTLRYDLVYVGYSDTMALKVWNEGHATLSINSITSSAAEFIADINSLSIAPGDTSSILVQFSPESSGTKNAILAFNCDDPDENNYQIQLIGIAEDAPEISVDPTQASMDLNEGDSQSTKLTILNRGEGLLKFDIQLSTQLPGLVKGLMKKNNNMSIEATRDNIIQRSGILNHEIRVASVDRTTGEEKELVCSLPEQLVDIKYANITSFSGLDVAILGADYQMALEDVQTKLLRTNKFNSVTVINVEYTTPSLTELQAFDAVQVYIYHDYNNYTDLGNNLAAYVDQGGGVVCMMFECGDGWAGYLDGRWNSQEYYVIERGGDYYGNRATLGAIAIPNHPIMQGVSSFDGGYASYRPETTNLTSGATLVASWSDGKPLVAVKRIGDVNRVDLAFFPVSNDLGNNDFWDSSTDGALLMANALTYAAGGALPWCEVDPMSGNIQSNNSQQIDVTFDASAVDQGTHQGNLIIANNDPNNSNLNVPLTLNVTDNTAPGAISDLSIESVAANFAIFSWTAPGDNGTQGTAESYELRYSNQSITETNWSSAITVQDTLPNPAAPGTKQTIRITGLLPYTTYYFAIKTKDEADNHSELSNVMEVLTNELEDAIIYLPFEESSGDIALNYQGNELFNGQLNYFDDLSGQDVATNSGWTQFGFAGGALKFDGSNDYVSIPDYSGSPLQLNTGLTLQAAVKPRNDILSTGNNQFYDIISKLDYETGYALRFNLENGRLRFIIQYGQNNVGIYESTKSSWAGGEWYEIKVTFDYNKPDQNVKIFIDNQLDASYDETRLLTINDNDIIIGGGRWEFPGTIDEVLIHNVPIENHPPQPFDLSFPEHKSELDTLNFTFQWQEAHDEDEGDFVTYKFQLSDDFTFDNIIIEQITDDTSYSIESGLQADATYYWKVIAFDADSAQTECSEIYSFETSRDATLVELAQVIPTEFELCQNYPNPFNPITTINYSLPQDEHVTIKIYNIHGKEVATLCNQKQTPGKYSITWDAKDKHGIQMSSGLYLYQIKAGEFNKTLKMSLVK